MFGNALKRIKSCAIYAGLFIGCLSLTALLLLGSARGREYLLSHVLQLASNNQFQIETKALESKGLLRWKIGKLRITYQHEPWIDIRQLEIAASLRELLKGSFHIYKFNVNEVDYVHRKIKTDSPKENTSRNSLPPPIIIDALTIESAKIQLDGYDLNKDYKINASASLFVENTPTVAELRISSKGDHTLKANIRARQDNEKYFLIGKIEEASGGILARLIDWPKAQSMNADFDFWFQQSESNYYLGINNLLTSLQGYALSLSGTLDITDSGKHITARNALLTVDQASNRFLFDYNSSADQTTFHVDLNAEYFPLALVNPWYKNIVSGEVKGSYSAQGRLSDFNQANSTEEYIKALTDWSANSVGQIKMDWQTEQESLKARLDINANLGKSLLQLNPSKLEILGFESEGYIFKDDVPSRLRLQGKLNLDSGKSKVSADIKKLSGKHFSQFIQPYLPGLAVELKSLAIAASGNLFQILKTPLRALEYRADAKFGGRYADEIFNVSLTAEGTPDLTKIKNLTANVLDATIDIRGDLAWQGGNTELHYQLSTLDVARVLKLPIVQQQKLDYLSPLLGNIAASGVLKGELGNPTVTTRFESALQYEDYGHWYLAGDSEWKNGLTQINSLSFESEKAAQGKVSGTIETSTKIPAIDLEIDVEELAGLFLSKFGWPDELGDANLSLDINTAGANSMGIQWLNGIRAKGKLNYLTQVIEDEREHPLQWNSAILMDKKIALDSEILFADKQAATLTLNSLSKNFEKFITNYDLIPDMAFNLNADLSKFAIFLPEATQIQGAATADLQLSGKWLAPSLNGVVSIEGGQYETPDQAISLHNIGLLAEAKGSEVKISSLEASDGGSGSIKANGLINWQEPDHEKAVALIINFDRANLVKSSKANGNITGKLDLNGSLRELLLSGALELSPFYVSLASSTSASVPEIKVTTKQVTEDANTEHNTSLIPELDLDLTINIAHQAYIEGRGIYSELEGGIHLTGPTDDISAEGNFDTVRGTLELFGKRFELQRGNVGFSNQALSMLIYAVYKGREIEVTAQVSGTTDNLKIEFTSVPDFPQDEILARLIFGRSVQQMTAVQALQLAAAIQKLRGGESRFDILGDARDFLGVDTLTVDSEENDEGRAGVAIGAGKYLAENVFIEVKHVSDSTTPWLGTIYIELLPNVTLESTAGSSEEDAETKLIWKRDY